MARSPGTSGLALGLAVAGGVVLYSGLRNATVADTLKGILKGQLPQGAQQQTALGSAIAAATTAAAQSAAGIVPGVTPPGDAGGIVEDAKRYLGVPYKWAASSPTGMDCSGFVNWVIGHDLGLPIPGHPDGHYSGHGPVTGDWYTWPGATTIGGIDAAPGDLVCWPSHIGIYVGNGQMIDAPTFGEKVKIQTIWKIPLPIYRRLNVRPVGQGFGSAGTKTPGGVRPI
jgi:cell wall-associated NlpC family hydrolase